MNTFGKTIVALSALVGMGYAGMLVQKHWDYDAMNQAETEVRIAQIETKSA